MATKFERIYSDMKNDLVEIKDIFKYNNLSQAFGHNIIKMLFGLNDSEVYDCNTDGSNDNGIDAIYFEKDKVVHFFQFKFPESQNGINNGVSESEILKLCNGFDTFTGNDNEFNACVWNSLIQDKREEFLDLDIYKFKLWFVRYSNQLVNQNILNKLNNFIKKYEDYTGNEIEYEFVLASECSKLYENTNKNIWPNFKLKYNKSLMPFTDENSNIYSAYVSLKDVYETFKSIQDTVFEGNVRYLNGNSKINDGIKETILHNKEKFHLLNNGITIVCNNCRDINAKSYFDVENGTIINGAQTVGMIINTLCDIEENVLNSYDKSFLFVKIISFRNDDSLINEMVYTLNTQNQMKNSYSIANNIIIKNLQEQINKNTHYFLEIKNNEYNYLKTHDETFDKLAKNKIDIETIIQTFTTFYNVDNMAFLTKNSKANLFIDDNISKIINEITFEKAIQSYEVYLRLMEIIKDYRAYRKNIERDEILNILKIDKKDIDDYRYLNTGNFIILFALGRLYEKKELDLYKNMIPIIKHLQKIFKKEKNISNATKIKESFEKVEKYIMSLKVEDEQILLPRKKEKIIS